MTTTAFDAISYDACYPDGYTAHYWHVARDRHVLAAVQSAVKPGNVCLEIGCGRGHMIGNLRHAGYDAWGVELGRPSVLPQSAAYVETGRPFQDLAASVRAKVQCVLLLDVIEHIEDAPAFLRDVRAAFPALEALVVAVPARSEIWSNYDTYYGHFRRYDRPMLHAHLSDGGFQSIKMTYLFRALYLAALGLRALGRERAVLHQAPAQPTLHRMIAAVLNAESWVLPAGVAGSSVLSVARPRPAA
jgi:hypothetical protein